jgi:acidic leucine-rich nuclear phosphoprotein 32 family protein B
MDEAWERAVEAALDTGDEGSSSPPRSLTLDGAVKCMHGRLPAPAILERHQSLEHLSIAGVGVASLAGFPRLRNLTRLTLSDNRIAGGLEHLVEAGLASLRDLDLSNNRIQDVDDLAPLARLRLVSLDLYECPVTRVKDYRSRVFGLIRTLKYLDKMDADENERPESDDDDDDGDGETARKTTTMKTTTIRIPGAARWPTGRLALPGRSRWRTEVGAVGGGDQKRWVKAVLEMQGGRR